MGWKVQLFKLNYNHEEQRAVRGVLDSEWITMGQRTIDFEQKFAEFLGHGSKCLAVSSGTAALHMALLSLGIKFGDEVITPSLTFVADQNMTLMVGGTNVLADITSYEDWSMDPEDIERRITPRTKAVMAVHYAGFACDMDAIVDLCRRHSLWLIEDCAHTPGASYKGRPLGTFGDIAAFSFFTNKNLSCGEGGMVAVRDDAYYHKLKGLRSHGMNYPTLDRYRGRANSYDVEAPGLNYRIDELRAALGLVQLEKLEEANRKRKELVMRYYTYLDNTGGVLVPFRKFDRGTPNYHIMPIMLREGIERSMVIEKMKADGIQTSIHYPAIQKFAAYAGKVNATPKAEFVAEHELTLPLYPTMTMSEVDLVCESLREALA